LATPQHALEVSSQGAANAGALRHKENHRLCAK
jgi:hypothetical protein